MKTKICLYVFLHSASFSCCPDATNSSKNSGSTSKNRTEIQLIYLKLFIYLFT